MLIVYPSATADGTDPAQARFRTFEVKAAMIVALHVLAALPSSDRHADIAATLR